MTRFTQRTTGAGFLALAAVLAGHSPATLAQTEPTGETYIAIVKGNDAYVRCGAAESYYPFTKFKDGDMVKVTGTKFEWSRVVTVGPAFENAFGYVKYAKNETGRFRLAPDGKSGQTLGKLEVIAPNLDNKNNPKDSWKAIVRLDADQTLRVLETIDNDKDIVLKVGLPETAQGWVGTAYLEPASPEQAKQWTESLAAYAKAKAEEAKSAAKPAQAGPVASGEKPAKPDSDATATAAVSAPAETAALPEPALIPVAGETAAAETIAAASQNPAVPVATKPEEPKLPTWNNLEAALKRLQREPIETAEVMPLRDLYLDLAVRSANDPRLVRYANGRADQLQAWADLQQKRGEVEAIRQRAKMSAEETLAVQKALESSAEYVAVGRVAASTIYDGANLPKLLRLQDAATGRTIAYLQPDEEYEVVNLIGNLVGIVGEKNFDGALRLNIVEPKRIDLLMPEERQTTAPTDQPRP